MFPFTTSSPNGFLLVGAAAVDDMAADGGNGGGGLFFTLLFRFNDTFESIESAGLVGFDGFGLFLPLVEPPPLPTPFPLFNLSPGMLTLEWADIMCCESVNKHIPRSMSVAGVVAADVFFGSGTNGRATRFRCDLLMKLLLTGTIVWALGCATCESSNRTMSWCSRSLATSRGNRSMWSAISRFAKLSKSALHAS